MLEPFMLKYKGLEVYTPLLEIMNMSLRVMLEPFHVKIHRFRSIHSFTPDNKYEYKSNVGTFHVKIHRFRSIYSFTRDNKYEYKSNVGTFHVKVIQRNI